MIVLFSQNKPFQLIFIRFGFPTVAHVQITSVLTVLKGRVHMHKLTYNILITGVIYQLHLEKICCNKFFVWESIICAQHLSCTSLLVNIISY